MANVDRAQAKFTGNREHLDLLLTAIEKEDLTIWNRWRWEHFREAVQLSGINLAKANLPKIILNYSDISGGNFKEADLSEANLHASRCEKATFTGANLHIVNLARAQAEGAYFLRANLAGGDLQDADFGSAYFVYSTLSSADFGGSNLTGAVTHGWNVSDCGFGRVTCDYLYTNLHVRDRIPKDRDFEPEEFERLIYKHDQINNAFRRDVEAKWALRHVFISYVTEDGEKVRKLSQELERQGLKTWLDKRRLRPGEEWETAIGDSIKDAMFFIACLSEHSESKQDSYQRKEIEIALDQMTTARKGSIWLIPVKLSDCRLPYFESKVGSLHWVDLSGDWDEGVGRIVNVVKTAPGEQGTTMQSS